jgi:hypothetical protein
MRASFQQAHSELWIKLRFVPVRYCISRLKIRQHGKVFESMESTGVVIVVLSGCCDPINFLWLCLPFTFSSLTTKRPLSKVQATLAAVGS